MAEHEHEPRERLLSEPRPPLTYRGRWWLIPLVLVVATVAVVAALWLQEDDGPTPPTAPDPIVAPE